MRRFLIDTDTASDDALALVMALRHPDIRVEAITVVAGNVPVDQAVQNALYVVELCGASVPVHAGAVKPLTRALQTAQHVHGKDGMGDVGLPLRGRTPAPLPAVEAIVRAVRAFPHELTLVTLGPLTNVALALCVAPEIAALISRVVVMGGVAGGSGNVTPAAEFNVWVDPEAARIVFESGLPIEMVGWDVSVRYATLEAAEVDRFRSLGPFGAFCMDIQRVLADFAFRTRGAAGPDEPDPLAMAIALDPSIVTESVARYVAVETGGEYTRGATVVDHHGVWKTAPNARVVLAVDRRRFLDLVAAALA
ncbi:MAG: nucleoside hydrolase [Acidothermus sp.]|nr:nucleoside hydrolase [Acidothermus sp.]